MHLCVCIPVCVGARAREHAEGCERGFGWSGSSPRPPGEGSLAGGCRLPRGSGGKFSTSANRGCSQKHRQPLQGQVCKGALCPVEGLEGTGSFCRVPVTMSPLSSPMEGLPSQHLPAVPCTRATQKRSWELFGEHG